MSRLRFFTGVFCCLCRGGGTSTTRRHRLVVGRCEAIGIRRSSSWRVRRGFVLLLTLVVLALMTAALAALARRAHRASVDADASVHRLQQRWMVRSVEGLLASAPELDERVAALQRMDNTYATAPIDSVQHGPDLFTLVWSPGRDDRDVEPDTDRGSRPIVRLVFADEQAKTNLNTFWSRTDPDSFQQELQTELIRFPASRLRVHPRPLTDLHRAAAPTGSDLAIDSISNDQLRFGQIREIDTSRRPRLSTRGRILDRWPAFGAFEQVFALKPIRSTAGSDRPASFAGVFWGTTEKARLMPAIMESLAFIHSGPIRTTSEGGPLAASVVSGSSVGSAVTLWGDGRLRIDRASPVALRLQLRPLLSDTQLRDLVDLRVRTPGASAGALLGALELTERQAEEAALRITDLSASYSARLTWWFGGRRDDTLSVRAGLRLSADLFQIRAGSFWYEGSRLLACK